MTARYQMRPCFQYSRFICEEPCVRWAHHTMMHLLVLFMAAKFTFALKNLFFLQSFLQLATSVSVAMSASSFQYFAYFLMRAATNSFDPPPYPPYFS